MAMFKKKTVAIAVLAILAILAVLVVMRKKKEGLSCVPRSKKLTGWGCYTAEWPCQKDNKCYRTSMDKWTAMQQNLPCDVRSKNQPGWGCYDPAYPCESRGKCYKDKNFQSTDTRARFNNECGGTKCRPGQRCDPIHAYDNHGTSNPANSRYYCNNI